MIILHRRKSDCFRLNWNRVFLWTRSLSKQDPNKISTFAIVY